MRETYTVKPGDTLYGISNQFGVSVVELANLNNVKANNLQIGQVLNIPTNQGTNPNAIFVYTVKSGDSLYKIATKYNTTVATLKSLNNLKSDKLSIGQKLNIPENYTKDNEMELISYQNYTVKKGDTLYSIARTFDIPVDTIIKDNNLSNNNLSIGQNLKLRITSNNSAIEECFGTDYIPKESTNFITYTVKKGDNLYNIARIYGSSVNAITNLNNLTNANLSIGQVLKIPTTNSTTTTSYTVKNGDNLYAIARRFNTTVDSIKKKNKLSSNLLNIGQVLII